jgi:hypothetical protein
MVFDSKDDPISWFFQKADQPLFSHADVLTLAGERLTSATLQNWANRLGHVKPKKVGRQRRYDALEIAEISLALPLIFDLEVSPSAATGAIMHGMLIFFYRTIKSKKFSLEQAPHLLGVFKNTASEPIFFDPRKAIPKLFETDEAFIVLPLGRLLNDLAKRQRELVESRPVQKAG